MIRISFSPVYRYALPEGHRFPMEKYELIPEQLLYEGLITEMHLHAPKPIATNDLLLTHSSDFVQRVLTEQLTRHEVRRIGFPMTKALIDRELIITQGTIDAARYALAIGCSLNVAGGTHHAYAEHGEGFCIFNDFAVMANVLLKSGEVSRILIVDLDVHQGNGTAKLMEHTPEVFTFSMHGATNFPAKKERSSLDIPLPDGTEDNAYLTILEGELPRLIDLHQPDLICYLAGVDVLATDRLGKLALTREGCRARDAYVLGMCHKQGIPVVVAMGGGYSTRLADIVEGHCNTYRVAAALYGL